MEAHDVNKSLTKETLINPKTGRPWSLIDPEVREGLHALQAELRDPSRAQAFLQEAGFLTLKSGKLTKRYGG